MQIGYFMNGQLMVCVTDSFKIFPTTAHRLERKLVDRKRHNIFVIDSRTDNVGYKRWKCSGFYLIEPLLDGFFAKLDAKNLS